MRTRSFTTLCGLLFVASTAVFVGCKKDSDPEITTPGEVDLQISNVVGTKALALDGTAYATPAGETFTVATLKYYVSNLKFTKSDGTVYAAPNTYFLVDQAQPASQRLAITGVPAGTYTGVSFVVGVDAATTQADPLGLTGALNPANSMYWVWATGHISMKMEGTVTSASPARPITCHIGGYTDPNNAIVTATPALNGNVLRVNGSHTSTIAVQADVLKLFDGANHITLSTFSNGMMPGPEAMKVAKNYAAGMFTVTKTQVN
ncbi:hypothetical protein QMK33_07120 [Hymenobacter sp. H14-R3]|uniref:MbnP family protein n=1 Tax=Hymenobacter sp. H14-R3 TaxID=3046308 RepID=UPI0024B94A76|nr:MbnP family protein [Hymenobacter sp. H14-R3]MDJ0364918.1 hypothetical protein [Hymenobacter sp. H14-R3]